MTHPAILELYQKDCLPELVDLCKSTLREIVGDGNFDAADVKSLLIHVLITAKQSIDTYFDNKPVETSTEQKARWKKLVKKADAFEEALDRLKWHDNIHFILSEDKFAASKISRLKADIYDLKLTAQKVINQRRKVVKPSVNAHQKFVVSIASYLNETYQKQPEAKYYGEEGVCRSSFAQLIVQALPHGMQIDNGRWIHRAIQTAEMDGEFDLDW